MAFALDGAGDPQLAQLLHLPQRALFGHQLAAEPTGPKALTWPDDAAQTLTIVGVLTLTAAANLAFCVGRRGRGPSEQESRSAAAVAPSSARSVPLVASGEAARPADAGAAEEARPAAGKDSAAARVDTKALTGLRGLAALHVACGHYSGFSTLGVDWLGGASMSFFYLLSGFVMTLGYVREPATEGNTAPEEAFDRRRFWGNRFARLFPSYLLTNLLSLIISVFTFASLPPEMGGGNWTSFLVNLGLTLCGLNMWLYPLNAWISNPALKVNLPTNAVTWTVQTMGVFYLLFPTLLPWMRSVQRRGLVIHLLYWLQATTFFSAIALGYWINADEWGYWVARAWPLGRLSVFAMGCLAALERRHGDAGASCFCLCASRCAAGGDSRAWGRRATRAAVTYLVILVAGASAMQAVRPEVKDFSKITPEVMQQFWKFMFIRAATEALVPLLFVHLIVSLSHCGDQGWVARLCRSAPLQRLGDLSMNFYMSHVMILMLADSLVTGKASMAPIWLCGVCMVLSLIFGWLMTDYFEAPCRKFLRVR